MEGAEPTIYVTPAPPRPGTNTYLIATGDSESDLASLGPTNPPIPTRCCAICNGDDYEGVTHTLTYDVFGASPVTSCASFTLYYWNDGSALHSWYCVFHDSNTSTPLAQGQPSPIDPNEPAYHYLPMSS